MRGQRSGYGLNRRWEGNYLKDELNGPSALVQIKIKDGFKEVLYAGRILKYNKQHKSSDRALLISDAAVYKLDGKNFKAMKGKIPFSEVNY